MIQSQQIHHLVRGFYAIKNPEIADSVSPYIRVISPKLLDVYPIVRCFSELGIDIASVFSFEKTLIGRIQFFKAL